MSTTATRATSKTGKESRGKRPLLTSPKDIGTHLAVGTKNDEDIGAACDRNKKYDNQ